MPENQWKRSFYFEKSAVYRSFGFRKTGYFGKYVVFFVSESKVAVENKDGEEVT